MPQSLSPWKRFFWRNTLSSYVQTITRLLVGVVLFRQTYSALSPAEFGFWSLLWSLFGYGVLLDFGFGFTAQKAVAEKTATEDWLGLSRLLSTVFWTFMGLAICLFLTAWGFEGLFLKWVKAPLEDASGFNEAYQIFFIGMALVFPLGIFPEILRGLQRIDLANWIQSLNSLLFLGILLTALHYKVSFPVLMSLSVGAALLPNLCAAVIAIHRLPHVSFAPRHFDLSAVKSQLHFSIAAYLVTCSNLIMSKSDQLVISLILGVSAVTVYQAGAKMGEMLNLFCTQLQSALSPAAAHLNAKQDKDGLLELMLKSSRLTFLVATPCYLLSALYLRELIQLLTGMTHIPSETYWTGQALLFAIFSSQLTNSCTKRILMMCGFERTLLYLSLADAGTNLVLSIILAQKIGVVGVAIGTLIPTVFFGWCVQIPLTLRTMGLKLPAYLGFHFKGTKTPLLAFTGSVSAITFFFPLMGELSTLTLLWELGWRGTLAGAPTLALSWKTLKTMKQ